MAYQSPHQPQSFYQYSESTPPPPPPKPPARPSGTPLSGPPLPPPPQSHDKQHASNDYPHNVPQVEQLAVQPPADGWLPDILRDKTYAIFKPNKHHNPNIHTRTKDLHHILQTPALQHALVHNPETAHPSLAASTAPIQALLAQNIALAESLKQLESHVQHQRDNTQSRLLSLRALERQWRDKQTEQDETLREFSPPAMYQRLNAAVAEQEALCRGLEESFLEGEGTGGGDVVASEREVTDFVRRLREGRKVAYLRAERKERWDEGRVGGWR
ncbi:hypothetical protein GQ44DRAFT_725174 [Phaeosphaeriaceae sp. PMI808]|nr:hypothetical protein GQ44DRAFT_725174 [Phaeosphaeriaceae sp. PMI808]